MNFSLFSSYEIAHNWVLTVVLFSSFRAFECVRVFVFTSQQTRNLNPLNKKPEWRQRNRFTRNLCNGKYHNEIHHENSICNTQMEYVKLNQLKSRFQSELLVTSIEITTFDSVSTYWTMFVSFFESSWCCDLKGSTVRCTLRLRFIFKVVGIFSDDMCAGSQRR